MRLLTLVVALACLAFASVGAQQPAPPTATAAEVAVYEAFRLWITKQPPATQNADDAMVYERYAAELKAQGKGAGEIAATLVSLKTMGDRAEIERWNRILTASEPRFNTAPNAFLASVTAGLKPGRSLDVGMGQGRNTIYLAEKGWDSAGFDPADRAVAAAQAEAAKRGVKIAATVARAEQYAWGENRWDLIVLSYVGAREYAAQVVRALRPGGLVVVEGFHRDATKTQSIGGAVVFDTNELPRIFSALRVLRYEETNAKGDFGQGDTRVVRLAAVKGVLP